MKAGTPEVALWGFAAPIAKEAYKVVSPAQFLFGRYLLASLIFLPVYLIFSPRISFKLSSLKIYLPLALLGTPLCLLPLYLGLQYTSAIEASIHVASGPIFTILAGHFFLKEHISRREKVGVAISILGTLILLFKPLILDGATMKLSLLGNLLITLSNLIWTSFVIFQKKCHHIDSSKLLLISSLISIPFFLVFVLFQSPHTPLFSPLLLPGALPEIIYMAVLASLVAFWAHTEAQNHIAASQAAIFSYLQPVFALPLAIFWLGESLSPIAIVSFLLIIIGVYISESRS